MARNKARRQSHGSAWLWKQSDAWYYALPGTKRRVPLHDEDGRRIKSKENKKLADSALARIKLQGDWNPQMATENGHRAPEAFVVARVCSEYFQYCESSVGRGAMSGEPWNASKSLLTDLCRYCGALPVDRLKKGHVRNWLESHAGLEIADRHRLTADDEHSRSDWPSQS